MRRQAVVCRLLGFDSILNLQCEKPAMTSVAIDRDLLRKNVPNLFARAFDTLVIASQAAREVPVWILPRCRPYHRETEQQECYGLV